MKRILFVDDDQLVVRIYKEALARHGFYVEAAHDGVTATKALLGIKPDLMVLDVMMPKLAGVEVLKFVRSQPELSATPVIVLSNSYLDDMARDAAAIGAQRTLLKVRCTPSILISVIRELLEGAPASEDPAHLLAVPNRQVTTPERPQPPPPPGTLPHPLAPQVPASAVPSQKPDLPPEPGDLHYRAKARHYFLEHAASTCTGLRNNFQAFARAKGPTEREMQLQNLYRQVHFLAASAGLAECYPIARMASVFEAMLFELTEKPALHNSSVLRTCALAIDFFNALFQHARSSSHDAPPSGKVLVVDDDPLSNRLIAAALRNAQLQPRSTEDPYIGLQCLRDKPYDLILLDIEMPGMDGFELCKRLRQLPAYKETPVIYVTGHSDFESRAKSALSGGDDLIGKPVFAMELAVKAMTHLLSNQLAIKPMAA